MNGTPNIKQQWRSRPLLCREVPNENLGVSCLLEFGTFEQPKDAEKRHSAALSHALPPLTVSSESFGSNLAPWQVRRLMKLASDLSQAFFDDAVQS